jgi:hypothetical protein
MDDLRTEVQVLREQVREKLLVAAQKASEGVLQLFPKTENEKLGAVQAANIRWEMLKAGFAHEEIFSILSKLTALSENKKAFPANEAEWTHFVEEKYLGYITPATHRFSLALLQRRYTRRLTAPLLNSHERAVYSIGTRIRSIMERVPAQVNDIVNDLAKSVGVQPEIIWRVATGGTRVTGSILTKLDHHVRAMENDLELDAKGEGVSNGA